MKNIAILHFAYPPNTGGVESIIQKHALILADLGYKVHIYTGSGKESDPRIDITVDTLFESVMNSNSQLQDKILKSGVIDKEFYETAQHILSTLETYLKNEDVVIVHNMLTIVRNLPFVHAFKIFAENHPEKKIIAWTHDHSYINEFKIKNIAEVSHSEFEKNLLTTPIKNVVYVSISDTFKKPLAEVMHLQPEKIPVIPDGIYIKDFLHIDNSVWNLLTKIRIIHSFPIILAPVNILDRKNLEYSIDIVHYLKQSYQHIKLVITGNVSKHHQTQDYYVGLKNKIHSLELDENVVFLTEHLEAGLNSSEMRSLYNLSHAVFYFSLSENFGLPLLESALMKTPIFASDLAVFREIMGNNIYYVNYKSVRTNEAALQVKLVLAQHKEIQANFIARTKFELSSLILKKLIPIID